MKRISHYDVISWGYEYFTEKLHGGHRLEAIDLLRLDTGQAVLDVPCGTGANLPLLEARIGPTGHVYGCDFSAGMLARARAKVTTAGWGNVTLVEADARALTPETLGSSGPPTIDAGICMLGLSVVPDWEQAFDRMYDLVRPGGRFVVMDLFLAGKRTSRLANGYYRAIAQAQSTRRFWEPLERRCEDVQTIDHEWFGGVARIVAGTKRG
ncbi:class I SAM-dependent methyltransferase [uncultured Jatrophihabitans sp.]|uniref:class I SAM-dependent methyltransferase n=1 Tax=uncultured Jatrophihabitans sp. TaxID=1610747 RepID=UPI0035CB059F